MVTSRSVALCLALAARVLAACADEVGSSEASAGGAELYARVEAILNQSCAREVCHGFMVANAHLDLMRDGVHAALVGVPSCEYAPMARVEPGRPERSWVMVKLAGPVRFRQYADFIDFTPAPGWRPGAPECASTFDDGAPWFGTRMPPPDTTAISADEIETVRSWIAAGAPGPGGSG